VSSPITFSGFNNIDFNSVLNALMAQASQPLTDLQNRQTDLKSQASNFDALNSRITSLSSAADALGTLSAVSTVAAQSNDASLTVTAASSAHTGHYDVVVTDIARAQVTASTSVSPDATSTAVATGGTLTIGGVDVAVTGAVTLQQLADAINATDGIGVSASAVRTGTNAYKLVLTSLDSGAEHAFSVTNGLTGGSGVTFGGANAVDASDASILINNVAATSSSNTFTDIVPGLTLTVTKKDAAKTISVDVTPDTTALSAKVNSFISAYNSLITYIDSQRAAANTGDTGSIGRDPLLRQLRTSLRDQVIGAHGSGVFTRLTEVGVEFTRDGTLSLDQTKFDAAVAANGDQVRQLFAGTDGAFGAVGSLLDSYSQTNGVIPNVKDRLTQQASAMDAQIAALQDRLAQQRLALQQEFTQADLAISQLKDQSSSLASIGSGYTL
jgi:flagellar hook-associated protein 2